MPVDAVDVSTKASQQKTLDQDYRGTHDANSIDQACWWSTSNRPSWNAFLIKILYCGARSAVHYSSPNGTYLWQLLATPHFRRFTDR